MHAFSTCTTALEKRPPPPSHSASYNITSITCMYIQPPPSPQHNYVTMHAFSICATALGKRPPAPPSHSASYNITSNHHHYHHHDHHSTNYNASIQYMCHCLRKNTTMHHHHHTVQVTILRPTTTTTTATTSTTTAQITMHAFSICVTALGKKQTTSASYCRLGPAPAPFRPPLVPRSTCAQWWKIRTTSANYRGSKLHRHHWRARCSKHL